jgi:hypothetical protein
VLCTTKNTSYYYYILCRRHLDNLKLSTEIEGKKKNLLGSGKLQHVGFSSKTQDEITKKKFV